MGEISSRIDVLQFVRAFAASVVLFYHSVEAVSRLNSSPAFSDFIYDFAWLGNFGVDLFFVISGFIMIYVHHDDFAQPGANLRFLANRLRRIVPSYWLLTSVGVLVLWLMPGISHNGRTLDLAWIVSSYLFLPWTSESGVPVPVLGLGWTLNFEMYFYLIFSVALLFPRRVGLSLLSAVFALSILAGSVFEVPGPLFRQLTSWLLAEFLGGVFVGLAFRQGWQLSRQIGILLLVLAVVGVAASLGFRQDQTLPVYLRFVFFGLPAVMIISTLALVPAFRSIRIPGFALLLGNASYALYLTHVFCVPIVPMLVSRLSIPLPAAIAVALSMLLSVVVAVLFYGLFERPCQAWLRPARKATLAERRG